jgi:alpha-1,6-mannosyltransferase
MSVCGGGVAYSSSLARPADAQPVAHKVWDALKHGDMESLAATANGRTSASLATRFPIVLRVLGVAGLVGVPVSVLGVVAGAAGSPTQYVPARIGGWPGWLSGPLHGLGLGIGSTSFQALTLAMCASYAAVLLCARALPGRWIAFAILAANVALLLGPPLISQDVFGYLAFARLGALHGLDPYTHVAAQAPTDAVFAFIGWPFQHSPYGPLFTLGSYGLAPLGLAGGLWTLKTIAVAASLAAVALTASAARRMGRSAKLAAAFVGLNPVLLELAVGGAHNDTLVLLALAGALVLAANPARAGAIAGTDARAGAMVGPGSHASARADRGPNLPAAAAALVAGIGVKASVGLVLPFVVLAPSAWRERARVAASAAGALALLAIVAIVGFGAHAFGFLGALGEQQQLIATHSIPAETARLVGLSGVPSWWRNVYLVGFALVLALTLWGAARGADWRAMAGWATLALLLSTAWLLPWYAVWALPLAALADSRRLRAATLAFCAYAILIHLPLANPLLSPPRQIPRHGIAPRRGAAVHDGVVFAGLQIQRDAALDLVR